MLVHVLAIMAAVEIVVSQRPSPCPEVFTYEPKGTENDRWYGVISLNSSEEIVGIRLHVILDKTAQLLGNWFGEATSSDNKEFVIRNPSYELATGQSLTIRFFIKYNEGGEIPSLREIQLNGRVICRQRSRVESTTSPQLHISQIRPTSSSSVSSNNNNHNNNNYGTVSNNRPVSRPNSNSRPSTNSRPSVTTNSNSRPTTNVNSRPNANSNSNSRPSVVNTNANSRPVNSGSSRPRPSVDTTDYNTDVRPSNGNGASRPRPSTDSYYNTDTSGSSGSNNFGYNSEGNSNNNNDYDNTNKFTRTPTVVRRSTTPRYDEIYNTNEYQNNDNNNDDFMGNMDRRRPNMRTTTSRYNYDNNNNMVNNFGSNNNNGRRTTTSSYEVNVDEDGYYATRTTTSRYDTNSGNDYNYFGNNNNMRRPSGNINNMPSGSDSIIFDNTGMNKENGYNTGRGNTRNPGSSSANNFNNNNYNTGRDPDYDNTNNYNNRPSSSVSGLSGDTSNSRVPWNGGGSSNSGSNSGGIVFGNDYDDESTSSSDFFQGDFAASSQPVNRPSPSVRNPVTGVRNSQCGTVTARPNALISHAQGTSPGEWPWHVALYHSKGIELTYTCGGTLISDRHVITAAHCVTKPRTTRPINPENLLAYLGKYNLKKFGSEVQDKEIATIYVHPEYNSTNYFNDVAILKLNEPAEITSYVRPCCLWEEDTDLDAVNERLGVVVGWGFDQNRRLSTELMKAEMPVVSNLKCIYSNRDFFSQFTFEKTYCAGFRNGTTVCNGDSGGGMYFPKTGRRGDAVWQIRGLVSVGVALQGEAVCDPSHYAVFTDVAKHLSWIQRIMRK